VGWVVIDHAESCASECARSDTQEDDDAGLKYNADIDAQDSLVTPAAQTLARTLHQEDLATLIPTTAVEHVITVDSCQAFHS